MYGTHNSCTYGNVKTCLNCIFYPWISNQNLDIIGQLEIGVRWFDFRLSYFDNNIYLSHTFLMTHSFDYIMDEISNYITKNPLQPFIIINIRTDYNDRENKDKIEEFLVTIIDKHRHLMYTNYNEYNGPLLLNNKKQKILFYNQDNTLFNEYIVSSHLMPEISLWDAGTIEECERRISNLERLFEENKNFNYIYPNERHINFDYSSYLPICYTDKKQFELMIKYKNQILLTKPTIISGNYIENIIKIFE